MTTRTKDKLTVFKGILTAWVLSAAFIGAGYYLSRKFNWFADIPQVEILSLTLLPPAFALALGIGWAARTRHFGQNIDGSAPKENTPLDITLRYITNTTEQLILFALMVMCLSGATPTFAQGLLPILGVWFLLARLLFWFGYVRSPLKRAVGFASTFHPTIFFLCVSAIALLS